MNITGELWGRTGGTCPERALWESFFNRILHGLVLLLLIHGNTWAQESLREEVSYPYLEKLIAVAKANYPKKKAYEAGVEVAGQNLKKAKLSYFDILSFSYLFSPTQTTATISPTLMTGYQFGLFVNIGAILQKPHVVGQARGDLKVAKYNAEAYELSLEAEVKKRYFLYLQYRTLYRIRTSALLDVEALLKEMRRKFEQGTETLESYSKALLMQSDHTQGKLQAESEMLIAQGNLEELLGQKLSTIHE